MIDSRPWTIRSLSGVDIHFSKAGDTLEVHSHPTGQAHLTFIRKGRFLILRPDGKAQEVRPGMLKLFEPDELHGYKALDDNSFITNVVY